jgi:phage terminase large subunit-like protein
MRINRNYKDLFLGNPDTRYFTITGGRGSGKSFVVSVFLLNLTYEKGHIILFTRYTMTAAYLSIIPEFRDKIELIGKEADFDITRDEVVNKHTGSKIIFRGLKNSSGNQTANLKSIQGVTTWVLDEAEELTDEDMFDRVDLSVRATNHPNRIVMVMNPSHKEHFIYKRFIAPTREDVTKIHTTYLDNAENLSDSFIKQAQQTKERNEFRYRHLFLGEWLDEAEGLLWNQQIIDRSRLDKAPQLTRVVVAIDPAVTANEKSDETGIIVAAKDSQGNGYILDDFSGIYTPNQWATVAIKAARQYDADCIVGEVNQGGDMVESTIRGVDKRIRYKAVRATKGKYTRAEPVYNLYEQGKIFHVGEHPLLERQMITFNPDVKSPDRVDALVWGLTDLLVNPKKDLIFI